MVKLGMIVRADFGRGLAEQTRSFYEALNPAVTVCVDMSQVNGARPYEFAQDLTAYPDAILTQWRGYTAPFINPDALDALRECDVVYSAETYYDERLPSLTKTILHVNPEFWRNQSATQYWYPTSWMTADLPSGFKVPTPIKDSDIATDIPHSSKLLHVGGHRTIGDRNGSNVITGLLTKNKWPLRLTHQDGLRIHPRALHQTEVLGAQEDRWSLYEGCGMLVYPRRYGGQSLVVNEAAARGLAILMGNNPPNLDFPIVPIPVRPGGRVKTPGGLIQMWMILTAELEDTITVLMHEPELLESWQWKSLAWARDHSWGVWKDRIWGLIEDAAS
jgi:hypothetical protein